MLLSYIKKYLLPSSLLESLLVDNLYPNQLKGVVHGHSGVHLENHEDGRGDTRLKLIGINVHQCTTCTTTVLGKSSGEGRRPLKTVQRYCRCPKWRWSLQLTASLAITGLKYVTLLKVPLTKLCPITSEAYDVESAKYRSERRLWTPFCVPLGVHVNAFAIVQNDATLYTKRMNAFRRMYWYS